MNKIPNILCVSSFCIASCHRYKVKKKKKTTAASTRRLLMSTTYASFNHTEYYEYPAHAVDEMKIEFSPEPCALRCIPRKIPSSLFLTYENTTNLFFYLRVLSPIRFCLILFGCFAKYFRCYLFVPNFGSSHRRA